MKILSISLKAILYICFACSVFVFMDLVEGSNNTPLSPILELDINWITITMSIVMSLFFGSMFFAIMLWEFIKEKSN